MRKRLRPWVLRSPADWASSAVSSPWYMPASAAMTTALCLHARRWKGLCNIQKDASARPTEAVQFANSLLHYAVTMPSTARRTRAPYRSVSTSNISCGSIRFSTGCSRPSYWGDVWPPGTGVHRAGPRGRQMRWLPWVLKTLSQPQRQYHILKEMTKYVQHPELCITSTPWIICMGFTGTNKKKLQENIQTFLLHNLNINGPLRSYTFIKLYHNQSLLKSDQPNHIYTPKSA